MPSASLSPTGLFARWCRQARRLGRDERGATAVELAILAIPFFALIGAILETAMVFLAGQVLDGAVQDASRYIRTGQVQTITGYNTTNFRAAVCSRLFGLFNCNNLRISVTNVANFTAATTFSLPVNPTDPTKWTLAETWQPGTGSSVELVQVYYQWPVFMNFGGFNLGRSLSNRTFLLGTTRVFMNEPFT